MKTNLFKRKGSPFWHVRKMIRGHRHQWNTGETDRKKAEVAAKAWLKALLEGAKADQFSRRDGSIRIATILKQYEGAADVRARTKKDCMYALRLITRECGLPETAGLNQLTQERVRNWLQSRIKNDTDSARRTANSYLRQAKAVFTKDLRSVYAINPPEFLEVPYLKVRPPQYRLPDQKLIDRTFAEAKELKDEDPSAYVAFILCACGGMRKGEAGHARWDWIQPNGIRITQGHGFRTKSGNDRMVWLDPDIIKEIEETRRDLSPYIIPGAMTERTEMVFRRLGAWMKGMGWNTQKKAHELRKYLGAQVATQAGLFAAQKMLGHSDPAITSRHYADIIEEPKFNVRRPG